MCGGGGGGGGGEGVVYRDGNFELKMHFYYTNRGAHIYLAQGAIIPLLHHWLDVYVQHTAPVSVLNVLVFNSTIFTSLELGGYA